MPRLQVNQSAARIRINPEHLLATSVGKRVRNFKSESTAGDYRLSDNAESGKNLVLFFYPKDNTPGCTTESQDFKANHRKFARANTVIIGVSRDTMQSHKKFREKFDLPFALISDPDEKLCEQFGVMKLKNMYGKKVRGVERSTFLIRPDRTLIHEWRGVKVPGHVDQVLEVCKSILR